MDVICSPRYVSVANRFSEDGYAEGCKEVGRRGTRRRRETAKNQVILPMADFRRALSDGNCSIDSNDTECYNVLNQFGKARRRLVQYDTVPSV